jgi:hypothetical protein
MAPTTQRETLGIKEQMMLVVGAQKLDDTSSPYYKALDWIVNKDPMKLDPNAPNLKQRYLSALFYYQTTEFGPWLSCNPAEKGQNEDCNWAKLVSVFPNAYQQVPWIRWLSSHHECLWAGVFCDEFNQTRAFELCKFINNVYLVEIVEEFCLTAFLGFCSLVRWSTNVWNPSPRSRQF